jgi:hypothetical protein
MIRIGLPPSVLPRLRLRGPFTPSWRTRQTRALQEYASRTTAVPYAWLRRLSEWATARLSLRARAAERQRAQLAEFEEKYEQLVDLLCWAAKEGDHTGRDRRYAELRAWMGSRYHRLRPRLRPYFLAEGAESADPFAALFTPECVEEVLHAETSVEDLMRTRAALDAYRATL